MKASELIKNKITIEVPEGMEVDQEKSTFTEIYFKPIQVKPLSWVNCLVNVKKCMLYFY